MKLAALLLQAHQLLVVTSPGWDAVPAQLQRWERVGKAWRAVGEPIAVSLGRSGIGWGTGVHPAQAGGPVKKEGDGRAPAGVFQLGSGFGYSAVAAKWPWMVLTPTIECVDDVKSIHYNRIVDRSKVKVDWSSSEVMRRSDELYRMGIVVEHNAVAVPGDGSCIFLHIRNQPNVGTAGCTAMDAANIETVVKWLDPAKHPLLVQLPTSEYVRLKGVWQLP